MILLSENTPTKSTEDLFSNFKKLKLESSSSSFKSGTTSGLFTRKKGSFEDLKLTFPFLEDEILKDALLKFESDVEKAKDYLFNNTNNNLSKNNESNNLISNTNLPNYEKSTGFSSEIKSSKKKRMLSDLYKENFNNNSHNLESKNLLNSTSNFINNINNLNSMLIDESPSNPPINNSNISNSVSNLLLHQQSDILNNEFSILTSKLSIKDFTQNLIEKIEKISAKLAGKLHSSEAYNLEFKRLMGDIINSNFFYKKLDCLDKHYHFRNTYQRMVRIEEKIVKSITDLYQKHVEIEYKKRENERLEAQLENIEDENLNL